MDYATKQKRREILIIIMIAICIVLLVIGSVYLVKKISKNNQENRPSATPKPTATPVPTAVPTPTPTPYKYINEAGTTILSRFNPPDGFTRISVPEGSFGEYLRNLPLKPYTICAYLYNGVINESAPWHAVIDQEIAKKDIQQCADTVMRFWAEYLFHNERYSEISFDFFTTPVFKCDFVSWAEGKRVKISGNKCTWKDAPEGTEPDYSYENLTKYLEYVYVYANTNSYKLQTKPISVEELTVGDMIIATTLDLNRANPDLDASLGHAMIIADIAENAEGERVYLIVEGNTPATQPYVISANEDGYGGIWVKFDENGIYHSFRNVTFPADAYRRLG